MTAAGVTPLEHPILSGHFPLAKAPLVSAAKERAWWRREAEQTFRSVHG